MCRDLLWLEACRGESRRVEASLEVLRRIEAIFPIVANRGLFLESANCFESIRGQMKVSQACPRGIEACYSSRRLEANLGVLRRFKAF